MKSAHPVRDAGGKASHVRTFEGICIGWIPRCRIDTMRWLLEHDFIKGSGKTYVATTWAYRAWCQWVENKVLPRSPEPVSTENAEKRRQD